MQRFPLGRLAIIAVVNSAISIAFINRYSLASFLGSSTLLEDLGMTASHAGFLGSLYYGAYAIMQVPSGVLTDRANVRWLLSIGTATTAVSILLFAVAPSYFIALLSRVLLGVGSGLLFLPGLKLCAGWVGNPRFGTLVGTMIAWTTLTAPLALLILPAPLASLGWRWTLVLLAVPLVPFVFLIHRLPDGPEESPFSGAATGRWSFGSLAADYRAVFGFRRFVALTLTQLAFQGIYFGYVTWLPRYAVEALGQSPAASGILPSISLIGMVASAPIAGWLAGRRASWGIWLFYGASLIDAGLLAALVVIYPLAPQTPLLVQAIVVATGFAMGYFAAGYISVSRTVPHQVLGTANGIYGVAAYFGGMIFPWLVGLIMDAVDRPTIAGAVYSATAYNTAFGALAAILTVSTLLGLVLDRSAAARYPLGRVSAQQLAGEQ